MRSHYYNDRKKSSEHNDIFLACYSVTIQGDKCSFTIFQSLLRQLITVDECLWSCRWKINRGTLRLFSEVLCDKIFLAIFFAGIAQLLLGIICFSDIYNSVCILKSRLAAALIFALITDLDWQGLYRKIRINLRKLKLRKIQAIDKLFLLFSYSLFYPPGLQETWSTVSRKYLIWIDIHVS